MFAADMSLSAHISEGIETRQGVSAHALVQEDCTEFILHSLHAQLLMINVVTERMACNGFCYTE